MSAFAASGIVLILALLAAVGAGIYGWSLCAAAVSLALLLLLAAWRARATAPREHPEAEWVVLAILLFLAIHTLPLPASLAAWPGSARAGENRTAAALLREGAACGALPTAPLRFAPTRNYAGTLRVTALFVAMAAAGLLASRLTPSAKRALAHAVLWLGAGIATAGIFALRYAPQGDTLWWRIPIPHGLPGPVACFVNRNHFGGYAAMLACAALGLAWHEMRRRRPVAVLGCLLAAIPLLAATAVSASRGAWLACGAGLVTLALAAVWRRSAGALVALVAIGALSVAGLLALPLAPVQERLASLRNPGAELSVRTRLSAWRDCADILRRYPVLGAGPNAFRTTHPTLRRDANGAWMTHAENEYAQFAAEGGSVGLLLLGVLLVTVLRLSRRPPGADEERLTAAALGAGATAAAHAAVDFPLHVPLYAITLAVWTGLAWSGRAPTGPAGRRWLAWAGPVPWIPLLLLDAALLLSTRAVALERDDAPRHFAAHDAATLQRLALQAPTFRSVWYALASHGGAPYPAEQRAWRSACLRQATACDPHNYRLWAAAARLHLALGAREDAREAARRAKALRPWVSVPNIPEAPP
jgi:O-antigen ligase